MVTSPPYDERTLLPAIAGGDEQAFAKVFHHYRNKIYTVVLRWTRSATAAEEILQDVFMKVWVKRETILSVEQFDSWLFILARNYTMDRLRRTAVREVREAKVKVIFDLPASADAGLLEKQYLELLSEAVGRLAPQQQQVYRLIKEEGLTRGQAADRLGLSEATIKNHLAVAMKNVRAWCLSRMDWCWIPLFIALFY